jgi:hypothetical protein
MAETEKDSLLEKAALVAFGAFLERMPDEPDMQVISMKAWSAAYTFFETKYDYILEDIFPQIEALKEILRLDGNLKLIDRYVDEQEPLKAYASDTAGVGQMTEGRLAIMRFLYADKNKKVL